MKKKSQQFFYGNLLDYIYKTGRDSEKVSQILESEQCLNLLSLEKVLGKISLRSIYLSDRLSKLNIHQKEELQDFYNEIESLLNLRMVDPTYSEDFIYFHQHFLKFVNEHWLNLPKDHKLYQIGIQLFKDTLLHHQPLTKECIEFFVKYRIKDLSLDRMCYRVKVSEEPSTYFNYFQEEKGKLTLYPNYLDQLLPTPKGDNKEKSNDIDLKNLFKLKYISATLNPIYRKQLIFIHHSANKSFHSAAVLYDSYHQKNECLKNYLSLTEYEYYKNEFIDRAQDEIFSIFDTNKMLTEELRDVFKKEIIHGFYRSCAHAIKRLYVKNFSGRNLITSPVERFDHLFCQYFPKEFASSKDVVNANLLTEIQKFQLGFPVSKEIIDIIFQIYANLRRPENLYTLVINMDKKIIRR